jgi:hypothetical protein
MEAGLSSPRRIAVLVWAARYEALESVDALALDRR